MGKNVLRVLKACGAEDRGIPVYVGQLKGVGVDGLGAEDRGIHVYAGAVEPLLQTTEPSSNYYGVDGLGDAPEVR